jgi:hypothetical protein
VRFFRRGPKDERPDEPQGWVTPEGVAPAPLPTPRELTEEEATEEDPTYGINLDPTSVADAKLSIKELRLRKKDLQGRKREIAAELSEERAAWRERQAGRISTIGLGRGTGGRIMRGAIQGKRRGERMQHADIVNEAAARRQDIDDLIDDVDRAIIDLERYILRSDK